AASLARLCALPALESAVVVLFAALPSAPSAYILARQLGADAPLAAVVITVETLAAMLTLPLVVLLCAGPHS
ncbi:MAG TPA: AEC family transporter, partial [Plasticicumulans sp.]|nr:AEC family transporter [Plasticicumulans sp.]